MNVMNRYPPYERSLDEPVWGRGSYEVNRSLPPLQSGGVIPPYPPQHTTLVHSSTKPPTESDIYRCVISKFLQVAKNRLVYSCEFYNPFANIDRLNKFYLQGRSTVKKERWKGSNAAWDYVLYFSQAVCECFCEHY